MYYCVLARSINLTAIYMSQSSKCDSTLTLWTEGGMYQQGHPKLQDSTVLIHITSVLCLSLLQKLTANDRDHRCFLNSPAHSAKLQNKPESLKHLLCSLNRESGTSCNQTQQKVNNSVVGTIVLHHSFTLACQETNSFCFSLQREDCDKLNCDKNSNMTTCKNEQCYTKS